MPEMVRAWAFPEVVFSESMAKIFTYATGPVQRNAMNVRRTEPTGVTTLMNLAVTLIENQFTREAIGYPVLSTCVGW